MGGGPVTSESQGDYLPTSPTENIVELLEVVIKFMVFYVEMMMVGISLSESSSICLH